MLQSREAIGWAAAFAFSGIVVSLYQILCHLRNYTEPVFQRYIIRIIFMVPVYAIGSLASLQWRNQAIYFDTMRDCYEAWIIYNFSSLLLAYVGGPGAVVVKAEGKLVHPSWSHMTCCLPTMQVDGFFLRRCKQGTLQFVLLKPVMALLTVILYAAGAYRDGDMSVGDGYFYISILYNVCYTFALYGLLLFWIGASDLLQPFNPLLKFVLVKTVVFLTFWQGIAISYINSMGEISNPEDGKALQNFMICVEMALAGVSLLFAFPHKEYQIGGSTTGWRVSAFVHAISIRDVVVDTIHVFAPSYSDYVLYSDGGPADNVKRKKYRGQKGNANSEHPKAGLVKNMEKGVMADDDDEQQGRRSKTPGDLAVRKMEAHRKDAILLDSDSDGMDSDDEGPQVGTEVAAASDDDGSDDEGAAPRHTTTVRHAGGLQSGSPSPATSRRTTKQASYKSNRGCHRSSQSISRRNAGPAAAEALAEGEAVLRPPGMVIMPFRGPILSDSDSDDESSGAVCPVDDSKGELAEQQQQQQQQQQPPSQHNPKDVAADAFAPTSHSKSDSVASGGSAQRPAQSSSAQSLSVPSAAAASAAMVATAMGAQAAVAGAASGRVPQAMQAASAVTVGAGKTAALPALRPPARTSGNSVARAVAAAAALWEPAFPGQQHGEEQLQSEQGGSGGGWAESEQGWSDVKL